MPYADPEVRRQFHKRYYQEHKEQIKAKVAQWKKDNPERAKANAQRAFEKRDKAVERERLRQYRESHRDIVNKRSENYRKNNPNKVSASQRNWAKNNPQKKHAQYLVHKAVAEGTLERPETCEICGRKTRIEGHHENYDKPLEVKWLCHKCHLRLHRKGN